MKVYKEGVFLKKNNEFSPIIVDGVSYKIEHLKDKSFVVDVRFANGDTRSITVWLRPTNHLFSRKVTDNDKSNKSKLEKDGAWLVSYQHYDGNYQAVKGTPPKVKEFRIFCAEKWECSKIFPSFVDFIAEEPRSVTALANINKGDEKTCLSGLLHLPDRPDEVYLVYFSLFKINSKEANMIIESAYCVDRNKDFKAKKLIAADKNDVKPFIVVLKNVMEGRKPFESLAKKGAAYKASKGKNKRFKKKA